MTENRQQITAVGCRLTKKDRQILKKAVKMGEALNESDALRTAIRRYGTQIGVLEDRIPA